MRPGGKDGFLYRIVFGAEINTEGTALEAGFYKIGSRAETDSGLPSPSQEMLDLGYKELGPGNIFFAEDGAVELAEGDAVLPMNLRRISFVTDVQDSGQKQSHDVTTQADVESGSRSFIPGAFQERTGTINGVVDVDSEEQRELFNEYREIVYQQGDNVGVAPAKSVEHEYMMSRRETPQAGETEMWEYMPLISESIQAPKPMDGVQSFSFNYKIDGKRKPCMIIREVA